MGDFAYDLSGEHIYTVSAKAAGDVLASKNPDAALLLLYIISTQKEPDAQTAQRELGLDAARYSAAAAVLHGKKAEHTREKAPDERTPDKKTAAIRLNGAPGYTRGEMAEAMADRDFAFIYNTAERAVGHPLLQHEVNSLLMIYDYLHMPADVTALLINHIIGQTEQKSTPEHPLSVSFRDIKNEALRWHEHEITTVAQAEQYIKDCEYKRSALGRVRRMLGITGRALSPTERQYILRFIELDPELLLIESAYDLTVTKKGSLVWPYMKSILASWAAKGYKTPADVEAGERGRKASAVTGATPGSDYDERVRSFLNNIDEEE